MMTAIIRVTAVTLCVAVTAILYAQEQTQPQDKPNARREFRAMEMGRRMEMMRRMMGRRAGMIQRLDKNGDGKVSRDEFPGPGNFFARLDQNSDGFITSDETAFPPLGRGGFGIELLTKQIDKNNDGKISKTEYDKFFSDADQNEDGFLTQKEIKAKIGLQERNSARAQLRHRLSPHHLNAKDLSLKRMDLDDDGKVSNLEFPGPDDIFKKLDTNGDSFLSKEELNAGRERQDIVESLASISTKLNSPMRHVSATNKHGSQQSLISKKLQGLDRNKDGRVSREEFAEKPEMFDKLDLNKDGFITKSEAIKVEMMRRRRESLTNP